MAVTRTEQFDNSRRTLYYEFQELPKSVGAVQLGPPNGSGKLPQMLPFSHLNLGDVEYIESNHAALKLSSTNDVMDVVYQRPTYGEVVAVEQRERNKGIDGAEAASGVTAIPAGPTEVHRFGWV